MRACLVYISTFSFLFPYLTQSLSDPVTDELTTFLLIFVVKDFMTTALKYLKYSERRTNNL